MRIRINFFLGEFCNLFEYQWILDRVFRKRKQFFFHISFCPCLLLCSVRRIFGNVGTRKNKENPQAKIIIIMLTSFLHFSNIYIYIFIFFIYLFIYLLLFIYLFNLNLPEQRLPPTDSIITFFCDMCECQYFYVYEWSAWACCSVNLYVRFSV